MCGKTSYENFLLKLSFKYTISVLIKQNVLLNIYILNFRTFRHLIKKSYSFLFLLKSYCFLYTGLSYYSDGIMFYVKTPLAILRCYSDIPVDCMNVICNQQLPYKPKFKQLRRQSRKYWLMKPKLRSSDDFIC